MIDHARLARLHEQWIDLPGYPLEPDFPREEYALRIERARTRMRAFVVSTLPGTDQLKDCWLPFKPETMVVGKLTPALVENKMSCETTPTLSDEDQVIVKVAPGLTIWPVPGEKTLTDGGVVS